jgi:ribonuclease R
VQVSRVDLDGRRIDFRMVRADEGERLLERGRQAAAASASATTRPPAAPPTAVEALAAVQRADRSARAGTRAAKAATRSRKPAAKKPSPRGRSRR